MVRTSADEFFYFSTFLLALRMGFYHSSIHMVDNIIEIFPQTVFIITIDVVLLHKQWIEIPFLRSMRSIFRAEQIDKFDIHRDMVPKSPAFHIAT